MKEIQDIFKSKNKLSQKIDLYIFYSPTYKIIYTFTNFSIGKFYINTKIT